jgi:hypothetical protein
VIYRDAKIGNMMEPRGQNLNYQLLTRQVDNGISINIVSKHLQCQGSSKQQKQIRIAKIGLLLLF